METQFGAPKQMEMFKEYVDPVLKYEITNISKDYITGGRYIVTLQICDEDKVMGHQAYARQVLVSASYEAVHNIFKWGKKFSAVGEPL